MTIDCVEVPCSRCKANPGDRCISATGRQTDTHIDRMRLFWRVFSGGQSDWAVCYACPFEETGKFALIAAGRHEKENPRHHVTASVVVS